MRGSRLFTALLAVLPWACLTVSLEAQQGGQVVVDSVAVEGNVRQRAESIVASFGINAGDVVTYRDIQRGIKALWSTRQFADVQVLAVGAQGETATLILRVEEQPILARVVFEGLEHVDEGDVRDTTGLRPGQPFSPVGLQTARDFIRAELSREGIPFAQIEDRRVEVPDAENQIELIIEVDEGQRVTVAEVAFEGNEGVSSEDLIGAMETKPEGFWWFRPGSYDENEFRQDLETRLVDLYESRGYLDFEILGDTILIDPTTGKASLQIQVEEGRRYVVRDFTIEGNRQFRTDELEAYFAPEESGLLASLGFGGDEGRTRYFDRVAFQEATDQVKSRYNNEGYLYATVEPFLIRNEPVGDEAPTVSVGWDITEGNPAYIRRVEIIGNDFTYDRVVRERLLVVPGDVYSEQRLIQSYQQISALGFFETPVEPPSIEPDPETGDVDITFRVTERQTGSVNFGTAVGGGVGVSGFLGYDQPNLFGQAKEGHLRWDFGRYINNFTVSYTDPAVFQSRTSATISLFNSRNRFFQFNTGQWKRLGGSLQVGLPLFSSIRSRVFLGYSLVRTDYDLREGVDDTSLFSRPDGTLSTFTLGVTRQTLNHPLFPTTGSRLSISNAFSGGPLGGDAGFSKHTLEGTWFVPVGQLGGSPGGIRFALGLTAKTGFVLGDATNFPFERFWMGGVQFGENLRGYDETSITPLGYFPEGSRDIFDIDRLGDAYLLLQAQWAIRFNDNLSLSLFYDAGNVWQDPGDIDPSKLFRGAGVGVQLVTPFGPLGLDYAYGFDKTSPGWQLHFRLGPGF
jgi:outer membrane protein insertion porin family